MSFIFDKCFSEDGAEFKGLYQILPECHKDARGFFLESWNKRDFDAAGINTDFVQDNKSSSVKGVLRGLHFQKNHSQSKLLWTDSGTIFDVAVDLRNGSETFGKHFKIILDSSKHNMLFIPKGFAHGFLVLSDVADIYYKCTDFYDPKGEGGILYNDPVLNIDWKSVCADFDNIILSEKDKNHDAFCADKKYFDINGKWIGN